MTFEGFLFTLMALATVIYCKAFLPTIPYQPRPTAGHSHPFRSKLPPSLPLLQVKQNQKEATTTTVSSWNVASGFQNGTIANDLDELRNVLHAPSEAPELPLQAANDKLMAENAALHQANSQYEQEIHELKQQLEKAKRTNILQFVDGPPGVAKDVTSDDHTAAKENKAQLLLKDNEKRSGSMETATTKVSSTFQAEIDALRAKQNALLQDHQSSSLGVEQLARLNELAHTADSLVEQCTQEINQLQQSSSRDQRNAVPVALALGLVAGATGAVYSNLDVFPTLETLPPLLMQQFREQNTDLEAMLRQCLDLVPLPDFTALFNSLAFL